MRHSVVVALEADVGGLHHVEDGAEGLMHKAMAKLESNRTPVTDTKQCMISIRVHRGTAAQGETTACNGDNVGACGSDDHEGSAAG